MTTTNNNNKPSLTLFIHGTLPWDSLPGDRLRQWSILVILALLSLLLIIFIEISPRVEKDRFAEQEVPERLAKLVMERKKEEPPPDRKSTRLNSSHVKISYAFFCLKKIKIREN